MAPEKGNLSNQEKLLFESVQSNSLSDVTKLLDDKDVQVDCLDEQGMTPLQHAAYRGNYKLCELLLDRGADVNSSYHDAGYTALMFAGLAGKLDVVSLLLEHGASTTAVNSVGRTAAQMASFVANHNVVSIISNFIPKEEIDYYTEIHGIETEPKLPLNLATPLHRFVIKTNIHPARLAMHLEKNKNLLIDVKKVVKVLDLLCKKEFKKTESNELLSLKFHHLSYVLKACDKFLKDQMFQEGSKNIGLEPLIKTWIKGRDEDGFPILLEKFLRQSVREYPYHESSLLQALVRTLSPVDIGNEPSAISILATTVSGQRGFSDVPVCHTCGEPNAEKRCSACKTAQYCDQFCQKLHWFSHKKQCPKLAEEYKKRKDIPEKTEESEQKIEKD